MDDFQQKVRFSPFNHVSIDTLALRLLEVIPREKHQSPKVQSTGCETEMDKNVEIKPVNFKGGSAKSSDTQALLDAFNHKDAEPVERSRADKISANHGTLIGMDDDGDVTYKDRKFNANKD